MDNKKQKQLLFSLSLIVALTVSQVSNAAVRLDDGSGTSDTAGSTGDSSSITPESNFTFDAQAYGSLESPMAVESCCASDNPAKFNTVSGGSQASFTMADQTQNASSQLMSNGLKTDSSFPNAVQSVSSVKTDIMGYSNDMSGADVVGMFNDDR